MLNAYLPRRSYCLAKPATALLLDSTSAARYLWYICALEQSKKLARKMYIFKNKPEQNTHTLFLGFYCSLSFWLVRFLFLLSLHIREKAASSLPLWALINEKLSIYLCSAPWCWYLFENYCCCVFCRERARVNLETGFGIRAQPTTQPPKQQLSDDRSKWMREFAMSRWIISNVSS